MDTPSLGILLALIGVFGSFVGVGVLPEMRDNVFLFTVLIMTFLMTIEMCRRPRRERFPFDTPTHGIPVNSIHSNRNSRYENPFGPRQVIRHPLLMEVEDHGMRLRLSVERSPPVLSDPVVLPEDTKAEEGTEACVICLENKKTHVATPCGHMLCCNECSQKERVTKCYTCRAECSVLRVFA